MPIQVGRTYLIVDPCALPDRIIREMVSEWDTSAARSEPPLEITGRDPEFAVLMDAAADSRDGHPQVRLVSGDLGIGKTRLLEGLTARQSAIGCHVIWGGSPPVVGPHLPLAPIVEMLRPVRRNRPDLFDRDGALFGGPVGHPGREPARLVSMTQVAEAFLEIVVRLASDLPLLIVVVEDLHWADGGTLDLLGYIVRNLRSTRVLLLVTFRSPGLEDRPRRVIAELERAGAVHVRLGPLPAAELKAIARSALGRRNDADALKRVLALADGNPYLAQQLGAALAAGVDLPDSIRDLYEPQVASLSPQARTLLEFISAAGGRIRLDMLWHMVGTEAEEVGAALEELISMGIVTRSAVGSGESVRVRQPLVSELVYKGLLPAARARLHHALARGLTANPSLGIGNPTEIAIEAAFHWRTSGDVVRALPALIRAAEAAERTYAFREADRLYTSALELLADAGTKRAENDKEIGQLRQRAAVAAALAGDPARAARLIAPLIEAAVPDDPRILAALGRYRYEAGDAAGAAEAYARAMASGPDESTRVRLLVGTVRAALALGQWDAALSTATLAVGVARKGRSATDLRAALSVLALAKAALGSSEEALMLLEESHAMQGASQQSAIRSASRIMDLVATFGDSASTLLRLGRSAETIRVADAAAVDAASLGAEGEAKRLRLLSANQLVDAGQLAAALAIADDILGDSASPSLTELAARTVRARVMVIRAHWEDAERELERISGRSAAGPSHEASLRASLVMADAHRWRRRHAQAAAIVSDALREVSGVDPRLRSALLELGTAIAAERHAEAQALRSADSVTLAEAVADLAGELDLLAERNRDDWVAAYRSTARAYQAQLLTPDTALWRSAADEWQRLQAPFHEAVARLRLAESILDRRESREDATTALLRSRVLAENLAAEQLLIEISLLAARARLSIERRPTIDRPEDSRLPGPLHLLSAREVEVLHLVAAGKTNREIADELFITEKTTAHHVSSILTKLDVRSRVEASAIAHRLGFLGATPPRT